MIFAAPCRQIPGSLGHGGDRGVEFTNDFFDTGLGGILVVNFGAIGCKSTLTSRVFRRDRAGLDFGRDFTRLQFRAVDAGNNLGRAVDKFKAGIDGIGFQPRTRDS
ncbi:hypothetical protein [Mobiluncus mulieris]|uniref:hypothetical protein n=1 Tax=Mobiluncus mulieris TaxID=2052 RepID=UPI000DF8AF00|nr:hypothetical protein [Mobiluncus mulieris]STY98464.1 Uncharacterised protein [Mobiluncus mulieris]